jgi:hypothetical protein
MSLFGNLKNEGLEETTDRIGGYQPFETDVYTGPIKMIYAGASAGGAQNVTVILDLGGREYRETIYVTNKKGENWFPNKDDPKKKVPLPGFTTVNDICLAAGGKELADLEWEDKVVKIYDAEAKKEMPKSVPVATELLGQVVSVGIVKVLENKSTKQGDVFVPTAETRTVNTIEKVFNTETRMTVVEARNGATEAKFWDAWQARNKDQTRDKRTIKDGQAGAPMMGRPGANRAPAGPPQAGAAGQNQRKSLFGNKAA